MGETPLITASYNGNVDIVKTLIKAKAQINTQDEVGVSLHIIVLIYIRIGLFSANILLIQSCIYSYFTL